MWMNLPDHLRWNRLHSVNEYPIQLLISLLLPSLQSLFGLLLPNCATIIDSQYKSQSSLAKMVSHVIPLLKSFSWLPVTLLVKAKVLTMAHKALQDGSFIASLAFKSSQIGLLPVPWHPPNSRPHEGRLAVCSAWNTPSPRYPHAFAFTSSGSLLRG